MHALVLADGDPPTRAALDDAWPGWDAGVDLVVAADGGARLADALGLVIDRWVGDGDSLGQDGIATLRDRGVLIELAPVNKNESDTELGLLAALESGATTVTFLGALGGLRPDHALANIALLGHPAAVGRALEILDPRARIRMLDATTSGYAHEPVRLDLTGRISDLVSLIPMQEVTGATTWGLQFPLAEATLPAGPSRTLSNIRTASSAEVSIRTGRLLVVEAPATLSP